MYIKRANDEASSTGTSLAANGCSHCCCCCCSHKYATCCAYTTHYSVVRIRLPACTCVCVCILYTLCICKCSKLYWHIHFLTLLLNCFFKIKEILNLCYYKLKLFRKMLSTSFNHKTKLEQWISVQQLSVLD